MGAAHTRRSALARAKNTARAEARRRTRAETRTADVADEAVEETPAEEPRKPFFTMPNIREDILVLPSLFRTRKLLWVPVILLLVGFGLNYAGFMELIPLDLVPIVDLYSQFFFVPFGLFTFFLGGFLAPRASYLVGFLLGLLNGLLWTILIFIGTSLPAATGTTAPSGDPGQAAIEVTLIAVLYGTFAAAFAAWYRNFLRQMQERGKQRRADREAQEKAKRREERRSVRRGA